MIQPSERDWVYLAGFFDGEGSILIYTRKDLIPRGKTVASNMRVTITNTDEKVIRWIHGRFGGNVYTYKNLKPNQKPAWKWTALSRQALVVLEGIRPWLIIKGKQADIGIRFQRRVSQWKTRPHPGRKGQPPVPKRELIFRARLANQLKDLRK